MTIIGARVHDRCDPRHTGHVESVMLAGAASRATVRWESTGWISYVALGSLVLVANEPRPTAITVFDLKGRTET